MAQPHQQIFSSLISKSVSPAYIWLLDYYSEELYAKKNQYNKDELGIGDSHFSNVPWIGFRYIPFLYNV